MPKQKQSITTTSVETQKKSSQKSSIKEGITNKFKNLNLGNISTSKNTLDQMIDQGYLGDTQKRKRIGMTNKFKNLNLGNTSTSKNTLDQMIDQGYLGDIQKRKRIGITKRKDHLRHGEDIQSRRLQRNHNDYGTDHVTKNNNVYSNSSGIALKRGTDYVSSGIALKRGDNYY